MDCSESAAGKALSGGLSLRAKSLSSLNGALAKGGNFDWGTLVECAADAYNDGIVGQLVELGAFSAGLYILNNVAGHWVSGRILAVFNRAMH